MFDPTIDEQVRYLRKLDVLEEKVLTLIDTKSAELEANINSVNEKLQVRINEIYKAVQLNSKVIARLEGTLKEHNNRINTKLEINDFESFKPPIEDSFNKLKETIEKNEKRIEDVKILLENKDAIMKSETKKLEKKLKSCKNKIESNIVEVKNTDKKFVDYLKIEELRKYKEVVEYNNKELSDRIISLHNNINPKALIIPNNKAKVGESEPDVFLQHLFDEFHTEAKATIDKQNTKIQHMSLLLDLLKKNLNTNLYFAAKRAVGQLKCKEELQSDYTINTESIFKTIISKKCDVSDIQSLDNIKANKVDLEVLQTFVDRINERLKYVITILAELINTLLSNKKESVSERTMKLSHLAYQVSLICKSIHLQEKTDINRELRRSHSDPLLKDKVSLRKTPTISINSATKRIHIPKTRLLVNCATDFREEIKRRNAIQDKHMRNYLKPSLNQAYINKTHNTSYTDSNKIIKRRLNCSQTRTEQP